MINRLDQLRREVDRLIKEKQPDRDAYFFSHLYGVSNFCALLAMRRNLNVEIAATCGMLHDINQITAGNAENHAVKGAEQAEVLLKSMKTYFDDEISMIAAAISRHSDKNVVHEPLDEVLKDADVMHHCLYDTSIPIDENEMERYIYILIELGCTAMECKAYPINTLGDYKYADIIALHKERWIFSKHKERSTWETQGGHIEEGETPLEAAKRELYEEAGAIDFDMEPLCDYWIRGKLNGVEIEGRGQVYFANVHALAEIPADSEMEKVALFDAPPHNLTYPDYTREIFPLAVWKKESQHLCDNM